MDTFGGSRIQKWTNFGHFWRSLRHQKNQPTIHPHPSPHIGPEPFVNGKRRSRSISAFYWKVGFRMPSEIIIFASDGPTWLYVWPPCPNFAPSWPNLAPTWKHLGPQDASRWPFTPPSWLQDASRWLQDGSKMPQDASKMAQDASKMPQDGSKMAQDDTKVAKNDPRWRSKMAPSSLPQAPR